jgi:dTDP-4-dehydrorhamnose reductase
VTAAERHRARGADIRAVTLWALFGVVDWRSMLTRREGIHEAGAFDVRSPVPRPTLVAKAAARLGAGEKLDHPVLQQPGWWRRPGRTYARRRFDTLPPSLGAKGRPLLIAGATGTLGQAFARICGHRGLAFVLTHRPGLDITKEASILAALDTHKPWAIINATGSIPLEEMEPEECFRINVAGPELLARACKLHGLPLVTFSSDLVFDGSLGRSYVEPDRPAPANAYGQSKAEAEQRLLAMDSHTLIVRTSAFFGPWDRHNFLFTTLAALKGGDRIAASGKTVVSPTYLPDLVHTVLDLLLDDEKGIWHLTNQGAISWHDLAAEIADRAKLDRRRIILPEADVPANTSLTSDRGLLLRPLGRALDDFMRYAEPLKELQ